MPRIYTLKQSREQSGFTLIEVMVALTIIAISLGALISSSGSQASSASYLKQKTLAHWVALNELAQLNIDNAFPTPGEKKRLNFNGESRLVLDSQNHKTS